MTLRKREAVAGAKNFTSTSGLAPVEWGYCQQSTLPVFSNVGAIFSVTPRILFKAIKSLWTTRRLYSADKFHIRSFYDERDVVRVWKKESMKAEKHIHRDTYSKKAARGSLAPTAVIYIFSFRRLDVVTWINNILFLSCFVICQIEEYSWLISTSVLHSIQNVISYLKTSVRKLGYSLSFRDLRLSFHSPSSATLKCPDRHWRYDSK